MKMIARKNLIIGLGALGIIIFFVITMCAYLWIKGFMKRVLWQKGNIRAEGIVNPKTKEKEFSRIYLGDPENLLEANIPIAIEGPNGEIIILSNLSADKIINMSNVSYDHSYTTIPGYRGTPWQKGTAFINILKPDLNTNIKLSYIAYSFAIIDGNVVGAIIYDEGCYGLWDKNMSKKYKFPLSQVQIEEIFGKPDKIEVWTPLIEF